MYISAVRDKSLIVERLPNPAAWEAVAAEWEVIDKKLFPRTPFTSPIWLSSWWKHFRRRNFLFRDEFFGHVVRDRHGSLVALVPLMRSHCLGYGPSIMRIVQFFGNDPSLTELRGIIC